MSQTKELVHQNRYVIWRYVTIHKSDN